MSMLTIDTKAEAALTQDGRLQRPWKVFAIGTILSFGILAIMFVQMRNYGLLNGSGIRSLVGFAVWSLLMSSSYAYIGAKLNKTRADRVIGWAGLLVALFGVMLVLWGMLTSAPPQ